MPEPIGIDDTEIDIDDLPAGESRRRRRGGSRRALGRALDRIGRRARRRRG